MRRNGASRGPPAARDKARAEDGNFRKRKESMSVLVPEPLTAPADLEPNAAALGACCSFACIASFA